MNVPGKKVVTIALIVLSGLTMVSASQTHAATHEPLSYASALYAPSGFSDTNVGEPARVDARASRGMMRTEMPSQVSTISPLGSALTTSLSKVEIVIAFALAQRGKPYRWGLAGPYGYDCSGLVLASFRRIGIYLPHFTGTMIHYGRYISRAQMRRGDIIFPSAHHVAIYLGGGKMIVAPHTGTVVQIQNVYAFYAARRLL